jgi:hypothetical protein
MPVRAVKRRGGVSPTAESNSAQHAAPLQHNTPAMRCWGALLLLACVSICAGSVYTLLLAPLFEEQDATTASGYAATSLSTGREYYTLLVLLLPVVTVLGVYARWLGMSLFRHQ